MEGLADPTPFETGWPTGHAAGRLSVNYAALAEVKAALERHTEELQSRSRGTPESLRMAARDLFGGVRYGRWRTGLELRRMHAVAVHGSIAIERALVANLTSFTLALGHTFHNYERSEEASTATILRVGRGAGLSAADDHRIGQSADRPPTGFGPGRRDTGRLWIPRPRASGNVTGHDPGELSGEMRRLVEVRAWDAHYQMSEALRAAGEFQEVLGNGLQAGGHELAGALNSSTVQGILGALERIWRTVRLHENDLRDLGVLSNDTGSALEALGGRWPGRLRMLITDLDGRYLEIIDRYPDALTYDLPFVRVPEPEAEPEPAPIPEAGPKSEGRDLAPEPWDGQIGPPPWSGTDLTEALIGAMPAESGLVVAEEWNGPVWRFGGAAADLGLYDRFGVIGGD
ncbi:MAG TPA: hypothetical protein VFX70_17600 [Mycobacteriales bacterium]|nr:hypothetical protein [Mycobacteriales bacterium]